MEKIKINATKKDFCARLAQQGPLGRAGQGLKA